MHRLVIGSSKLHAAHHMAVLDRAVMGYGVRAIDTGPHYSGGKAEGLVAAFIKSQPTQVSQEINVMTKVGIISQAGPWEDVVPLGNDFYHSMHPECIQKELTASLSRLGKDRLDCYMLHYPEAFLLHSIKGDSSEAFIKDTKLELTARFRRAFEALEEEVNKGRIRSYGISSSSFALQSDNKHFFEYGRFLDMAHTAARRAGHSTSSLSTIQMPANVFEDGGLGECASWWKASGVRVMVYRSLTAFSGGEVRKLIDAPKAVEYENGKQAALNYFIPPDPGTDKPDEEWVEMAHACAFLNSLILDLDRDLPKYTSIDHYNQDLANVIIPMLSQKFEQLDPDSSDILQGFFKGYGDAVRYSVASQTRSLLTGEGGGQEGRGEGAKHDIEDNEPLQEYALRFLLSQPNVDSVIVGATSPSQLDYLGNVKRRIDHSKQ